MTWLPLLCRMKRLQLIILLVPDRQPRAQGPVLEMPALHPGPSSGQETHYRSKLNYYHRKDVEYACNRHALPLKSMPTGLQETLHSDELLWTSFQPSRVVGVFFLSETFWLKNTKILISCRQSSQSVRGLRPSYGAEYGAAVLLWTRMWIIYQLISHKANASSWSMEVPLGCCWCLKKIVPQVHCQNFASI